ncbi:MAG: flagellar M-ring protein FliF, partial [Deltaproteobacteria bacterium RBG_19FT_COMBO_56_10]
SLYAQLSPEDSGAVIEKLKEKKVPYKVDGSSISVPADKVYETRMELAGEGLPQGGGVGFEIFDKTAFGVTDFVQKVNYKRALQGELSRTITQIKEIDTARVHLALPEKGVFLDEQKKARASVIVKLKPGRQLTQGQVSSIVHLVANSTDNLKPEDVAVVDTAGKMWTREADQDAGMMLSATQLEYKKSLEKDYEHRVQSMLEKAVGMNNVVARVSADVDTRHVERTEERYDPDGQVVRSEQRNKESSIGGIAALGVPGVLSN